MMHRIQNAVCMTLLNSIFSTSGTGARTSLYRYVVAVFLPVFFFCQYVNIITYVEELFVA